MRTHRFTLGLAALVSAGLLACVLLADEPEPGRRYALIVGVQDYKDTGLGSLRYCDNDAAGLADVLTQRGYRVTLMTRPAWKAGDRDDILPTADNIRVNLAAVLRNRKPADTVLLAFSGHGEQLKRDGKMYFCAAKCNLDKPETLIALDEVYALLKDNRAGGKVLIVDACRNDPLAGKTLGSEKLESVTRPTLPDPPGGTVALFSCSKGQVAYESDELKHGFLSYFVIEGLQGKAVGKGGRIKWTDLTKHVDDELPDAVTQELGARAVQTPEVRGESHGLVLAQVDAGSPDNSTTDFAEALRRAAADRSGDGPPEQVVTERDEKTEEFEYKSNGEAKKGARRVLTLDLGEDVTMEMVRIRAGKFMMGSPDSDALDDEKPRHEVEITQDFYLGKYLVTQQQFKALMGRNPSKFLEPEFPVESVTWEEAQTFCRKLTDKTKQEVILPTEAQWEYACRAGTTTRFPGGAELTAADANFGGKLGRPSAVGSYPANPLGLYDMTGNVWEWCADYYDGKFYGYGHNKDPINIETADDRVARGGSWNDRAWLCRAAGRQWVSPTNRYAYLGFRVAIRPH